MRAAVARIYSVDIMATFLLLSQPRTSTKNLRIAVPEALLSLGNVAERLFGCMAGLDRWKESPGFWGPLAALLSVSSFHRHLPFRAAAHLLLRRFPTALWVGWLSEDA